ncbi:MAG: sugar transferase [Firmicutes bacterium]|nr:sugar transferase [Bacillota bacterium]
MQASLGKLKQYFLPVPRGLVLLTDCVLTVAGYYLAFVFRFSLPLPESNAEAFRILLPWILLVTATVFAALGLYGMPPFNANNGMRSTVVAVFLSVLATMAGAYWFRGFAFPRTVFAIALAINSILIAAWRHIVAHLDTKAGGIQRLLVVSRNATQDLLLNLRLTGSNRVLVAGVVNPEEALRMAEHSHTCSSPTGGYDGVLLVDVPEPDRRQIIETFAGRGKQVLVQPGPLDILMASARTGRIDDHPLLLLAGLGLNPGQAFVKRAFDVAVTTLALSVSLPVMALISAVILLTSGPPILYRQQRVGLRGRVFEVWKFRTMHRNAEAETGPVLSLKGDPRVTPAGRVLRALRLDETPQLFNVLRGDMSIVGPRPERPEFVEEFAASIPGYKYRLSVTPGLTGLAQVRGKYSTDPEDKLLYDLLYIANYSLAADLSVIMQTIVTVLTPQSAEGIASPVAGQHGLDRPSPPPVDS